MDLLQNSLLDKDEIVLYDIELGNSKYSFKIVNLVNCGWLYVNLKYTELNIKTLFENTIHINLYYFKNININKYIIKFFKYKILFNLYNFINNINFNKFYKANTNLIINNMTIFNKSFFTYAYITIHELKNIKIKLNEYFK